jgi:hypothetical protein
MGVRFPLLAQDRNPESFHVIRGFAFVDPRWPDEARFRAPGAAGARNWPLAVAAALRTSSAALLCGRM